MILITRVWVDTYYEEQVKEYTQYANIVMDIKHIPDYRLYLSDLLTPEYGIRIPDPINEPERSLWVHIFRTQNNKRMEQQTDLFTTTGIYILAVGIIIGIIVLNIILIKLANSK